jgi:hypothetical protein
LKVQFTIAAAARIYVVTPCPAKASTLFNDHEIMDILVQQIYSRTESWSCKSTAELCNKTGSQLVKLTGYASSDDHNGDPSILLVPNVHLWVLLARSHRNFQGPGALTQKPLRYGQEKLIQNWQEATIKSHI